MSSSELAAAAPAPSSEPAAAQPPSSFLVTSDPTVQITIYDATRMLLGQAEGSLRLLLAPGLYRVHFERGGRVHHEIVDHETDTNLRHAGPALHSPVPFAGAATTHDDYIAPAEQFSAIDTAPPLGAGPHDSRVFVFVRRATRDGQPRRLPSEPVTLHDADGRELAAITRDSAESDQDAGWVAYSCRATPGTYRLRGARSLRDTAIVVPAGRTAQVFIADTGSLRLAELRLALVPLGARFDPRSPIWGAMEGVIAALRVPDRPLPLAARVMLPDAIDDDLCFGIAASHLLWRSGDRTGLAAAMRRLARYRAIPDVAILDRLEGGSAWAYQPLHRSPAGLSDTPPLLRASLALAMTRPELDPGTLSAYSAFAHAARTAVHDSVWCLWSTRTWDERWIEPAVERLREQDRQGDASAIARRLALATETVEQALDALDATTPSILGEPLDARDLVVPGYTLGPPIGRGARSTVYRARRHADEQAVALKLVPVPGGADGCARAHRELDRCPAVDHPQLLAATARGTLPGDTGIWLEMALCDGSVLDRLSEEDAPRALPEAHRLVLDALAVLAHLHEQGIAHGDLKPSNLLIRRDGGVAIAGPGLAVRRALPDELRHATAAPRLAPPELLRSDEPPTPASDVWAMAVIYYFLLTLEYPRDEYADQSQLEAALDNPVVSIARRRPDLPSELVQHVDAALSPILEVRPRDAGTFRERLTAIDMTALAPRRADDAPGHGVLEPSTEAAIDPAQAIRAVTPPDDPTRIQKPGRIRTLLQSAHTLRGRISIAMAALTVAIVGLLVWSSVHRSSDSCDQDPQFVDLRHRSEACLASYQRTGNAHDLDLAANAALELGDLETAAQRARLLTSSQPGDAYAILSRIALKQNHANDALRYAALASAVHSVYGNGHDLADDALLRAQAFEKLSDPAAGLRAADQALAIALQLGDSHAEVAGYLARADALREIGDVRGAIDTLAAATERATVACERAWVYFKLGLCHVDTGQDELAMASLASAARADKQCKDPTLAKVVSLNQAWLLRRRDPAGVVARLDDLSREMGEGPESLLLRSYVAADRGDLATAEQYLEQAQQLDATDSRWMWRISQARAELAEQHGGIGGDLLAEAYYRQATAIVAALRRSISTRSAFLISSHRGPYDGLIALLARQGRWRDALSVVLELDASDMLRATANEIVTPDREPPYDRAVASSAVVPPPRDVDAVLSAWRARSLVIVIAQSDQQIGSGKERVYRLRIGDGQVTGEDVGDAREVRGWASELFKNPGDHHAAQALGKILVAREASDRMLHVLGVGPLGKVPLAALRDDSGSLIISRRPVVRVLGLTATEPESTGAGPPVIIADPKSDLFFAAVEGRIVAEVVGQGAILAGSGTGVVATRAQLWGARDASLLHVAARVIRKGRWSVFALADGEATPPELLQHRLAPRLAVLSTGGSAAADEEAWGSLASALLEAGTAVVIAADRRVDDNAALSLMTTFYSQPDWSKDPVRALARAQAALAAKNGASSDDDSAASEWAAFGALGRPPFVP
jgi:serine/threonine protein kinase/Tfp pilus assembly protein PilF